MQTDSDNEREGLLPNLFYKANITLTPNLALTLQ